MTIDRIERIRQRAYELWIAEGRLHAKDIEYWLRAEQEIAEAEAAPAGAPEGGSQNEGEGNRTAALAFDRAQTAFARNEEAVEAGARAAEEAVEGPEGAALRRAEKMGRSRSRGEDPALQADTKAGPAKAAPAKAAPAKATPAKATVAKATATKPRRSRTKPADAKPADET